jgi:hypothetical protein
MGGLTEYSRAILDLTSAHISIKNATNREELETAFTNHLFRASGPTRVHSSLSHDDILIVDVFSGFSEIFGCHQLRTDLAKFPISGTKLSKVQYIRLNIECYLTETYIMKERLISYLKVVKKAARGSREIYSTVPKLEKNVEIVFEPMCTVRGLHTHKARNDDEDLGRVNALELLTRVRQRTELRGLYKKECRVLKRKWANIMSENNRQAAAFLDVYFETLHPFVFNLKGSILGHLIAPRM